MVSGMVILLCPILASYLRHSIASIGLDVVASERAIAATREGVVPCLGTCVGNRNNSPTFPKVNALPPTVIVLLRERDKIIFEIGRFKIQASARSPNALSQCAAKRVQTSASVLNPGDISLKVPNTLS